MIRIKRGIACLSFAAVLGIAVFGGTSRAEPSTQPSTQPAIALDLKEDAAVKGSVGKTVALDGAVTSAKWSASGSILRIKFEGTDKSHFLAVIFKEQKAAFDEAFGGDVAKTLEGATVHLEGPMTDYRGNPEMVLRKVQQLKMVKPAGAAGK